MQKISYKCHRFPPHIIAHVVWLYARFNWSLREVEELLRERFVRHDPSLDRQIRSLDRPGSKATAAAT